VGTTAKSEAGMWLGLETETFKVVEESSVLVQGVGETRDIIIICFPLGDRRVIISLDDILHGH
jgi:hypothetical protein